MFDSVQDPIPLCLPYEILSCVQQQGICMEAIQVGFGE